MHAHGHARRRAANGYIWRGGDREHRIVAERLVGRPIRGDEHVHHKNGLKWDNRPGNLEILTASEHTKTHATTSGLTDEQIKGLILERIPSSEIARVYGVWTHRIVRLRRELGIDAGEYYAQRGRKLDPEPQPEDAA